MEFNRTNTETFPSCPAEYWDILIQMHESFLEEGKNRIWVAIFVEWQFVKIPYVNSFCWKIFASRLVWIIKMFVTYYTEFRILHK